MAWLPLNLVDVARSGTILRKILPGFPSKLHDIIWMESLVASQLHAPETLCSCTFSLWMEDEEAWCPLALQSLNNNSCSFFLLL